MTHDVDLLNAVQPASGWFAVVGIRSDGNVRQYFAETREEVDEIAERFIKQERNAFFGVAKYKTDNSRAKDNVQSLKAFWLDIDCGESKIVPNLKTGKPDGYINQTAGLVALRSFCKEANLPKPIIVNSGRGLHVYWPLTEEITRSQWESVAAQLRSVCVALELYVDPAVFEVARILRIPGTLNFKDNPPTPVEIISSAAPVELSDFCERLGVAVPEDVPDKPKREVSAMAQALRDAEKSSFKKILTRSVDDKGCQQIRDCYENQDTISEPRWFDALSIAQFCADRDKFIHVMSKQHPEYNAEATETKANNAKGPHTCAVFEQNNPGGCAGCPHLGNIKSPISLGREIRAATEADNTIVVEGPTEAETKTYIIPEYPEPFFRGANGGVWIKPEGDEGEAVNVYPHDLYGVKRLMEPGLGDVVVMRLHTYLDGVKEFIIPNIVVTDRSELRKVLSAQGVMSSDKKFNLIYAYVGVVVDSLQYQKKAELMRLQFGWADNDSKFIIGDREIGASGTFHSPPSTITKALAYHMAPAGTLENWKEIFALYGRPGLEPHAFAALTSFGAPLLKFLGQSGAIINVIHQSSGTGKTTILHMCNSVWGHPRNLCAVKEDTANAKIMHMGVNNNLPFTVDEMTNMLPAAFSELAYSMSQGRGKNRMKSSGNELRLNSTTWQTISLCSSNASFYEKLAALKNTPEGEMMRLLEYKIDYSDAIDTELAKRMFDHELMQNYGHAGDIYAKYLVNNLEEVKLAVLSIQAKIDRELKLTQKERFWSAVIAANIAGGMVAKKLGLIDWDMKQIYQWVTTMVSSMRYDIKPPSDDAVVVIGDFINRHMQNILVVNDNIDRRSQKAALPLIEPRGELIIRYEPDTKRMFISAAVFKKDCVENQISYKETLRKLEDQGIYRKSDNKRLSKGMKFVAPGVHAIELDCSGSAFIDLSSLAPPELRDVD